MVAWEGFGIGVGAGAVFAVLAGVLTVVVYAAVWLTVKAARALARRLRPRPVPLTINARLAARGVTWRGGAPGAEAEAWYLDEKAGAGESWG